MSKNNNYKYININKLSFEENMVAIDGFHPNENFYKIWSEEISNIIKRRIIKNENLIFPKFFSKPFDFYFFFLIIFKI